MLFITDYMEKVQPGVIYNEMFLVWEMGAIKNHTRNLSIKESYQNKRAWLI